jgi:hypothetical protein
MRLALRCEKTEGYSYQHMNAWAHELWLQKRDHCTLTYTRRPN